MSMENTPAIDREFAGIIEASYREDSRAERAKHVSEDPEFKKAVRSYVQDTIAFIQEGMEPDAPSRDDHDIAVMHLMDVRSRAYESYDGISKGLSLIETYRQSATGEIIDDDTGGY